MVSVLYSSVVDHGFEHESGQTKDHDIGICCFSTKHAASKRKSKDWLARNQDNVSSGTTCLPYKDQTKRVGLEQSGPPHHLIEINLFSSWYSWKI